jgi:F-type H+-transporting ATPase subunit delta
VSNVDATVQERYATALLNVARRQNVRESMLEEAEELVKALDASPKALVLLEAPQFADEVKIGFLDRTIKGKFHEVIERLVYLLLAKRRIEYIRPVLARFVAIAKKDLGILVGEVTTAVELNDEQRSYLRERLEKYVKGTLTITYLVNPDVLGGVRFRCGDLLLDDTVAWRLESIKRTLEVAARRVDAA